MIRIALPVFGIALIGLALTVANTIRLVHAFRPVILPGEHVLPHLDFPEIHVPFIEHLQSTIHIPIHAPSAVLTTIPQEV